MCRPHCLLQNYLFFPLFSYSKIQNYLIFLTRNNFFVFISKNNHRPSGAQYFTLRADCRGVKNSCQNLFLFDRFLHKKGLIIYWWQKVKSIFMKRRQNLKKNDYDYLTLLNFTFIFFCLLWKIRLCTKFIISMANVIMDFG